MRHTMQAMALALVLTGCAAASSSADTATTQKVDAAQPQASATPTCPATDFEGFLKAFAADPAVRDAFTAEQVNTFAFDGPDTESLEPIVRRVDRSQYRGFNLALQPDGFHVADSAGAIDPVPVEVSIAPIEHGGYSASYEYGMSEGNSYRFEAREGCWQLVGETDPGSP